MTMKRGPAPVAAGDRAGDAEPGKLTNKSTAIGAAWKELAGDEAAAANLRRAWTGVKLDIAEALMLDPAVTDGDFRMGFRVLQAVNHKTRVAHLSDRTICDELSIKRNKCWKTRKRLEALAWWTCNLGHGGGRATFYKFNEEKITPVLEVRDAKRRARTEERNVDNQRHNPTCDIPKSERLNVSDSQHLHLGKYSLHKGGLPAKDCMGGDTREHVHAREAVTRRELIICLVCDQPIEDGGWHCPCGGVGLN